MKTDAEFRAWLNGRINDREAAPLRVIINLADLDGPISPLLATTADGMRAIKAHNARCGVFA